jgi:hypothetical protein
MNLAEIRSKVREIVDMDTDDVSDALLNMYIKDGYDRMISLERRWPFLEKSYTLSTVNGQKGYTISAIGSGDVREITSVVEGSIGGIRLTLVDHADAEAFWLGTQDTVGRPMHFSVWEQKLYIWPTPDAAYTLALRGFRKPTDWTANDATQVDADDRLHQSLVYYAVAQLYQLQEDVQLARFYRDSFDEAVRLAASDILRVSSHRPLVYSGGRFHESSNGWQSPVYF